MRDDELDELLGIDRDDPAQRLALDLVNSDDRLLRTLVAIRRDKNLTQSEIAARMGVTQPAVARFERPDSDPKLSTIRRYALAVGAVIEHRITDRGMAGSCVVVADEAPLTGAAPSKVVVASGPSSDCLSVAK